MMLFCVAGYVGLSKFMAGKIEAVDHRVKKRSERAVELELAHRAARIAHRLFAERPKAFRHRLETLWEHGR